MRWRALGKLAIVAVVSLLLGGIGFSYTFSLVRRTRKLARKKLQREGLLPMPKKIEKPKRFGAGGGAGAGGAF